MSIGEKIKTRREELGWSQQLLADKMGYTSKSTITRIEKGYNDVGQKNISRFADVLGVTIAYLMGWEKTDIVKYPEVAKNFATALEDNNMTQQQLADSADIDKSSVSHYCKGTHCPNNLRAIKLARILNVNPLWLMGLSDDKQPADNSKATELELLFNNASPEVQRSVLTLLKASQPLTEPQEVQANITVKNPT